MWARSRLKHFVSSLPHIPGALVENMKAIEQKILGQSRHGATGFISTESFEMNTFLRSLVEEQGKTALY